MIRKSRRRQRRIIKHEAKSTRALASRSGMPILAANMDYSTLLRPTLNTRADNGVDNWDATEIDM